MKKDLHPMWPDAPENLAQRLLHTLNIFEGEPDDMVVMTATTNQYAPFGEKHSWTGLTLGDLRALSHIAVGETYTMAEFISGCDFTRTRQALDVERSCVRCGTSEKDYDSGRCPKAVRR